MTISISISIFPFIISLLSQFIVYFPTKTDEWVANCHSVCPCYLFNGPISTINSKRAIQREKLLIRRWIAEQKTTIKSSWHNTQIRNKKSNKKIWRNEYSGERSQLSDTLIHTFMTFRIPYVFFCVDVLRCLLILDSSWISFHMPVTGATIISWGKENPKKCDITNVEC